MKFADHSFSPLQALPSGSGTNSMERLQLISARAASGKEMSDKEIKEVGQQFEAMLLHQLLSAMRKSVPKSGLFEESSASDTYKDLFDQNIAEQVAAASQTGIGETLAQDIKRQQQQVHPPTEPPQMIPFKKDENTYQSLQRKGPSLKPVTRDEPVFGPIPDQNPRYLPISTKSGSDRKVNIVG
jgi:Rod binding domain-containing protein